MSQNLILSFFKRHGYSESDWEACSDAARCAYPSYLIRSVEPQGYCSYTVRASTKDGAEGEDRIIQFRPQQYALDLGIIDAAKDIYQSYAPKVAECMVPGVPAGLKVYELDVITGVPYQSWYRRKKELDGEAWEKQVRLTKDFAAFVARAWPSDVKNSKRRECDGKVGANISSKLQQLTKKLPSAFLRSRAQQAVTALPLLDRLPVVLNHGDVNPSNIIVDPYTGRLNGLVDWAEAEWLAFGTCLYGLEFLLGWQEHSSKQREFTYYDRAELLRKLFWEELQVRIPDLAGINSTEMMDSVILARDVGVFLWYGFAWDEGKIDRVVNPENDPEEVTCLEAFLTSGDATSFRL
ncbi:hypothetical protein AOQ84DRAFT_348582 [Glonium stellatum]|uniref:Aminoglycoside phosphotransferase domain-containing protein n=1 Tax=Glonium stellatum TaxID=574774 RepID=A0A8E2JMQ0_9PEZI|nr:hypothetical protein AOQ84DRAFT_348582 [Glonium stellatum]